MSIEEKNKELIRRMYDFCNKGDLDGCYSLMDPAYVFHMPGGDMNVAEERQLEEPLWAAFPDISFTIVNIIAEGDLVAFRVNIQGTHRGTFMGMGATGKKFDITNSNWARVKNGRITDLWPTMDQLSLMQQLGAIPTG